jgi:hypothetical protein
MKIIVSPCAKWIMFWQIGHFFKQKTRNFLEFFCPSVNSTNFANFLGGKSPNFQYHKINGKIHMNIYILTSWWNKCFGVNMIQESKHRKITHEW